MHGRTFVLSLLLALSAGACATQPTSSLDAFAGRSASNSFETFDRGIEPRRTLVLAVQHDRQTLGASCGAHALASVINYWRGPGVVSGDAIYAATPPAQPDGYSLSELLLLAHQNGLTASGVRLSDADIVRELEAGRPVLVPVRVPSVFIQTWGLPASNESVLGAPSRIIAGRVGWLSEATGMAMLNHYLLVVGYEGDTLVVLEPVMGFRTIARERLGRYRRAFNNAAVVFSAERPPATAG